MTVTPIATETRWETYAEAAVRLGITAEAVRAHAKRQRWPRQRPNSDPNGPELIAIPPDFRPRRPSGRPGYDPGQPGLLTGAAEAFRLALAKQSGSKGYHWEIVSEDTGTVVRQSTTCYGTMAQAYDCGAAALAAFSPGRKH